MLKKVFAALAPYAPLPLRLAVGLATVLHGWQKVTDIQGFVDTVSSLGIPYGQYLAYASVATEVVGGVLLIVGFLGRFAALAVAVNMGVALGYVHLSHGYFLPKGVEYALALALGAFSLFLSGPGKASVDSFRGKV